MNRDFINEQVNLICKKYKISEKDAESAVLQKLDKNKALFEILHRDLKEIYKTRIYKDFIKDLKKDIYYKLRSYQMNRDVSAESHISTAERQKEINSFFEQITPELQLSKKVLDLGGGMFPITVPFEKFNFNEFVWVDKDKKSYDKLKSAQLPDYVELINLELQEFLTSNHETYDFAFMLKLIPVIYRQEKSLLELLSKVNAKYILITGSKEAMVKKQDIEYREDKIIKSFINTTNKKILKKIDLSNEFGYLLA